MPRFRSLLLATALLSSPALALAAPTYECYSPGNGNGGGADCDMQAYYDSDQHQTEWSSLCADGSFEMGVMHGDQANALCDGM